VSRNKAFAYALSTILLLSALGLTAFWLRPVEFFRLVTRVRLRLSGTESNWTQVQGYRVHYYATGPKDGPPVVLVHGLGGRADDWINLMPYLTRSGCRVYLPDLPGYGQSEQPAGFSYSVTDQASIVVGFLDSLGLKQVVLGGWSMGGWIVQRVAVSYPERVGKLLLFDSAGIYAKPDWNTALFTPSDAIELAQLDALLMPHPPDVPGFIANDIVRVSEKNAWVVHRALDSMLTGRETTDRLLPRLNTPVLIVWGAEDRITPLTQGKMIHSLIPKSQLEVIDGCGHLAPAQCASQIGPKVVDFVKRQTRIER
jgi:pimeloyl-ACP methyl ester carboxylesterase